MKAAPIVTAFAILCTTVDGAFHTAEAQESSDLVGGWIVTSWTTPDGQVDTEPQRGLFVFTASGQYSIMYVLGAEPRVEYSGEAMSDAETLVAYGSFVANSGRYSVTGNQITYEAYMAKDPNYMSGFMTDEGNAVTVDFSIEDGILTLRWTDGRSDGLRATLRRPGQTAG